MEAITEEAWAEYKDAYILIADHKFTQVKELLPILEGVSTTTTETTTTTTDSTTTTTTEDATTTEHTECTETETTTK